MLSNTAAGGECHQSCASAIFDASHPHAAFVAGVLTQALLHLRVRFVLHLHLLLL